MSFSALNFGVAKSLRPMPCLLSFATHVFSSSFCDPCLFFFFLRPILSLLQFANWRRPFISSFCRMLGYCGVVGYFTNEGREERAIEGVVVAEIGSK